MGQFVGAPVVAPSTPTWRNSGQWGRPGRVLVPFSPIICGGASVKPEGVKLSAALSHCSHALSHQRILRAAGYAKTH